MTITDKYREKYGPELLALSSQMAELDKQLRGLSNQFLSKFPPPKGYAWSGNPPTLRRLWDGLTEDWAEVDEE